MANNNFVVSPEQKCLVDDVVDVLVVGGGPAGIGAAVGAAYCSNLSVAIVDEGGCFGGAIPKSLITFCEGGVMTTGNLLLIKGVWQKVQDVMVQRGGAIPGHELIKSNKYYPFDKSRCEKDLQLTLYDPEIFKQAAEEVLTSFPNIKPILYTKVVGVIKDGDVVKGVFTESREGKKAIFAKRIVDASGCSAVLRMAGVDCVHTAAAAPNREGPILVFFRAGGISEVAPTYKPDVKDVPYGAINMFPTIRDHEYRIEMTRAIGDGLSVSDMTNGSIECRKQIPQILDYLRKNWPGCRNAYLIDSGSEALPCAFYKIDGMDSVKVKDALNCVVPDDVIALDGYGIDVHSSEKGGQNYLHYLEPGQYWGISFGCLLPKNNVKNIITAGKSVSCESGLESAVISTCTSMATGEAAGTACAISINNNQDLKEISVSELQTILKAQGALLEPEIVPSVEYYYEYKFTY